MNIEQKINDLINQTNKKLGRLDARLDCRLQNDDKNRILAQEMMYLESECLMKMCNAMTDYLLFEKDINCKETLNACDKIFAAFKETLAECIMQLIFLRDTIPDDFIHMSDIPVVDMRNNEEIIQRCYEMGVDVKKATAGMDYLESLDLKDRRPANVEEFAALLKEISSDNENVEELLKVIDGIKVVNGEKED